MLETRKADGAPSSAPPSSLRISSARASSRCAVVGAIVRSEGTFFDASASLMTSWTDSSGHASCWEVLDLFDRGLDRESKPTGGGRWTRRESDAGATFSPHLELRLYF